ncbi:MAG: ribonuclease D [Acidobacteriota bacterium]
MATGTAPDCLWIDTDEGLARLADELARAGEFAVDTESDGFHHYFDKLCLLQISTRHRNYVVDPLNVSSLAPLRAVLEDPDLPTVLHAAEQDLMYLRRDHDIKVGGLFDTLVGAQFIGHTRLGLANILAEYFGLELSKSNQLDDWSRRPLNEKQLRYAVGDTDHLLALRDRLATRLQDLGRQTWAAEECEALMSRDAPPQRGEMDDVTRVKGWNDLSPRGRVILQELMRVRDREARRRDRPAFRVVGNAVLLALVAKPPTTVDEVRQVKGFPRQARGRLAERLLAAVSAGLSRPESTFPPDPRRRLRRTLPARHPRFDRRLEHLRRWRKKTATGLDLPPGVVTPQRDLERLAGTRLQTIADLHQLTDIRAWRRREFGAAWLEQLREGDDGA